MKFTSLASLVALPLFIALSAHAASKPIESDAVTSRYRDDIDMMDRATPDELARILRLAPASRGEALSEEPSELWDPFGFGRDRRGGGVVDIRVDVSSQSLTVSSPEGEYSMPVSTARAGYHTATGCFRSPRLEVMHYSRKWDWAPMPHSMFYYGGYAIHGTYEERHLGRPASHGCIRVARQNAAYLFRLVQTYGRSRTRICVY